MKSTHPEEHWKVAWERDKAVSGDEYEKFNRLKSRELAHDLRRTGQPNILPARSVWIRCLTRLTRRVFLEPALPLNPALAPRGTRIRWARPYYDRLGAAAYNAWGDPIEEVRPGDVYLVLAL